MLGKVSTAGLGTVDRLAREVEQGRRSARWMGSGMAAMGLTVGDGTAAGGADLRAVFGRLEHPHPGPGEAGPVRSRFLGATPQVFGSEAERLARALRREPEASQDRRAQLSAAAARPRKSVAYYGLPFSAVKSVSVLYAALLAAGQDEQASVVEEAQREAAAIAVRWGEPHLAWTRRRARAGGHEWEQAAGLVAVATDRTVSGAGDPHLNTQVLVLNRVATDDGRVGAIDGRGIAAINSGLGAVYDRALEQLLTEALGVRFCVDDHGRRQIAGVGVDLQTRASRRRRQIRHQAAGEVQPGPRPDGAGDETAECSDPESRDAALQGWIREHHDDLGQALAAVHAAAASDDVAAQPPPSAEPGWIEAAVATALAHGPAPAGVRRELTLGQRIEIAETALGPAGDLGVPAARRPYLVEQAVAAVAGSAVERSY